VGVVGPIGKKTDIRLITKTTVPNPTRNFGQNAYFY